MLHGMPLTCRQDQIYCKSEINLALKGYRETFLLGYWCYSTRKV
ncbi:hypothetical protein DsansV1_C13g0125981 [Dioscorea sansibarensis]